MARRNDPFNKRNLRFGTNLVSTLIAWSIVAPFAAVETLSNTQSTSSNIDNKPISKPFAVILIIIGIALIPLFVPLISFSFECFLTIPLLIIPIIIEGAIISLVVEAFSNKDSGKNDNTNKHSNIIKSIEKRNFDSEKREAIKNKVCKDIEADEKRKSIERANYAKKEEVEDKQVRISFEEEIKEQERRRIMNEKCAKLRAEIEKDKEEERKQQLARFQYQYSEKREEIRKRIRKDIEADEKRKSIERAKKEGY